MANSSGGSDEFVLSESEKEQLLNAVQSIDKEVTKPVQVNDSKE
jgi:hypothetical protein